MARFSYETKGISVSKLESVLRRLQEQKKMFSVHFTKVNGEERQLTGYVASANRNLEQDHLPYITVFDVFKQDFRAVNLETVNQIIFDNKSYYIC